MSLIANAVGVVAVIVAALAAFLFADGLVSLAFGASASIRRRTRAVGESDDAESARSTALGPLHQAITATSSGWPAQLSRALVPLARVLDRQGAAADPVRLRQAGLSASVLPEEMDRARAWFGVLVGSTLGLLGAAGDIGTALLFLVAGFALGVRLPSFLLAGAARRRIGLSVRALPEMIDMIALGSRAGMTFDNAIAMYAERFDGPLADEFGRALEKWRVGAATRDQALTELAEAMDLDVVKRFVSSVLQALRLGSPLAKVLEEQAADARKAHKLALQAEIAKAAVKMFVPMGTLILPAMLILLLGPVILQIAQSFSGM